MRRQLLFGTLLLGALATARAQLSLDLGLSMPGVRIGINLSDLPQLVRVPESPAYYAPGVGGNYFYYEDRYWVYERDSWYSSGWYNGPWAEVGPEQVPLYVLRIPVRYYRAPPAYFRGWQRDAPPRWGQHWGPNWQRQRDGWDRWDRRQMPAAAPPPTWQRPYRGERYPAPERQQSLQREHESTQRRPPPQREGGPQMAPRQPTREGPREGPREGERRDGGRGDDRREDRRDDRREDKREDRPGRGH